MAREKIKKKKEDNLIGPLDGLVCGVIADREKGKSEKRRQLTVFQAARLRKGEEEIAGRRRHVELRKVCFPLTESSQGGRKS